MRIKTVTILAFVSAQAPAAVAGGGVGGLRPLPSDGPWAKGESWTDPAPWPGSSTPWPTDDPAIWAADACLGFYLTRDRAVFTPAEIDDLADPDWEPQLWAHRADPPVRVQVFDYPGGPYGVFSCRTTSWPHIGEPDSTALSAWAEARFVESEEWEQVTDLRGLPRRGINQRNDALGVSTRAEWPPFETMLIEVKADYDGPPLVFDGPGPF